MIGEIGLRTKYLSSDYKKPLCVELEDVKINQLTESDLEVATQKIVAEARCEKLARRNGDDVARYVKRAQDYFTHTLDYVLQFLPPTAMILVQVNFVINTFDISTDSRHSNPVFRHSNQKLLRDSVEPRKRPGSVTERAEP